MRFCVLASGSSGNASLLKYGNFGVLVDLGLGPRTLARRLEVVGVSWDHIHAAVLTHVHGDHWNENTLAHLQRRQIPLFCHREHATALKYDSPAFANMLENEGLRFYEIEQTIALTDDLWFRPLALCHDGGMTCGFRFEGGQDREAPAWALAYAADLGCWDRALADAFTDVDVLALEFNHDEDMERYSGRADRLIQRVLGDYGHLSNRQASRLLREALLRSAPGRLQHLVQLHLSRQCNRAELACAAALKILRDHNPTATVHTARQDHPCPWMTPNLDVAAKRGGANSQAVLSVLQPWLPGFEL